MAEDAIARARAIAAKLGVSVATGGGGGVLGKRSADGEALGLGMLKRKKVYVPVDEHPDVNFLGLLIGPRGETQKQMQQMSGAKVLIRGRGSQKDGGGMMQNPHPDDDDALHVCIEGSEEAVDKALREVERILFNPEEALRLKNEQLRSLNGGSGGGGGGGHYGSGGGGQYGQYGGQSEEGGYQVEMRVPNGMVGLIIGKGGENIQRMQNQTGAHVQIAKVIVSPDHVASYCCLPGVVR
jgi:far upstream element-binding protein